MQFTPFVVLGATEIVEALQRIDKNLRRRIIADASIKANKLIYHSILMSTPVQSGRLKSRIRDVATRSRSAYFYARYVRLPTRAMMGINQKARYYYPAHVLFGHAFPYRTNPQPGRKWGKGVSGRVAANPFMHRGFDLVEGFASEILSVELFRGIEDSYNGASR